jgi:DNA-binding transcriptional LysR family regulator
LLLHSTLSTSPTKNSLAWKLIISYHEIDTIVKSIILNVSIDYSDGCDNVHVKHLQSFLTAAKLLNFGEAARTLNYSQSTVSEQIHCLEDYLGTKLFERLGKRVFLTEQGKKLLPFAERMVRNAEELKDLFRDNETVSGALTIGAAESLCAFWLPPLLKEYKRRYPEVQLIIKVGRCPDFRQWLQQGIIDAAFSYNDEFDQPQLRQTELFRGETVFVASPDHELSACPVLEAQHLAGQTLLLPEADAGYRIDLENLLAKEHVKARTIMEFDSLEAIKQCVKNGLGVSHLPRIVVEEELKRGELIVFDWRGPAIPIQARMVLHREKWLTPPLAALEKLVSSSIM